VIECAPAARVEVERDADPPLQGQPYLTPKNIGICRIVFSVDDIDRTYADLKAAR